VVLAADDDPGVLDMLGKLLQHWGVLAHLVPDGAEAVELFSRHRAAITLCLLDVRMPGLDGPGALAAIRVIDPEVHCWFMTGDPAPYTVPGLLSLGATGVLDKPYTLSALRVVIDESARPTRTRTR
jgi:CheY-like chemotaxis protein